MKSQRIAHASKLKPEKGNARKPDRRSSKPTPTPELPKHSQNARGATHLKTQLFFHGNASSVIHVEKKSRTEQTELSQSGNAKLVTGTCVTHAKCPRSGEPPEPRARPSPKESRTRASSKPDKGNARKPDRRSSKPTRTPELPTHA